MAENSKIAWTTHTFNPWIGCTKVSDGCANCYAAALMDDRYGKVAWGPQGTRKRTGDSNWRKPLVWNEAAERAGERHRVFCASLADVCEDWTGPILNSKDEQLYRLASRRYASLQPGQSFLAGRGVATVDDLRSDLWELVRETPHLDWLILTKREDRIHLVPALPNIWMGVTIENADNDYRWRNYLQHMTQYVVRWVSAEPLLSRLPIENWATVPDWIIFGGESDQTQPARPCDVEWIRDGLRLCRERGIVPFVKQLGSRIVHGYTPGEELGWKLIECRKGGGAFTWRPKDKAGAEPVEWPEELRVREFPEAAHAH